MSNPTHPSSFRLPPFATGSQVVALRDVLGQNGRTLHPRGAVGVVVKSPPDLQHSYRVRFADGVEEAFKPSEIMLLAKYKEGEIGDSSITARQGDLLQRVIFQCVIGSQAYGLADSESDVDRRGFYLPPAELHWSLYGVPEQLECEATQEVYWEIQKFLVLALKANPNVLEQLLSPLVVHTTPEHVELKALAADCITKHHAHHYLGFAETQWKLFRKADPPHVKPLLYVYRVLLTGIHLMRTGDVEANLARLNETAKLPYIPDLIGRKTGGPEKGRLDKADLEFYHREYEGLRAELQEAFEQSRLPEVPSAAASLNDLLVRIRLKR